MIFTERNDSLGQDLRGCAHGCRYKDLDLTDVHGVKKQLEEIIGQFNQSRFGQVCRHTLLSPYIFGLERVQFIWFSEFQDSKMSVVLP